MKLDRKNSLQVTRVFLNLIFYKEVTDCLTRGMIPPRASAYKFLKRKPFNHTLLDEPLQTADLIFFLNCHSQRKLGLYESTKPVLEEMQADYHKTPTIRHPYLGIMYFDITPSKADRVLKRIGSYVDDKLIMTYLQFAISEFYNYLPEDDSQIELELTRGELILLWTKVTGEYGFLHNFWHRLAIIL